MESKIVRIIEWNFHEQKKGDFSKDRIYRISEKISALNPKIDIVVFTEVKSENAMGEIINSLTFKGYTKFGIGCNNINKVIIAVSPENINKVEFEDFYDCKLPSIHPDSLLVKVKIKDSDTWLKILGVRMQIPSSPLSKAFKDLIWTVQPDLKEESEDSLKLNFYNKQYESLENIIKENKPDIVIGDFNWYTAFEDKGLDINFYNFLQVKDNEYDMWPDEKRLDPMPISFINSGRDKTKGTSPDRVLYKTINMNVESCYYNRLYKTGDILEFEKNNGRSWQDEYSDHDMLIVDVTTHEKMK